MRKVTGKSGQAVADWRKGDISQSRLDQITEAVRSLLPEYEETPRPLWAEGLSDDVHATRTVVEANAIQLAALQAVLGAIRSQLPPPDDDPPDDPVLTQPAQRQSR